MYYNGPMMEGEDLIWAGIIMLFWIVVLVLVAVGILRFSRDHNRPIDDSQKRGPLDVVDERYAKGVITKEQFEELKKDLTK